MKAATDEQFHKCGDFSTHLLLELAEATVERTRETPNVTAMDKG